MAAVVLLLCHKGSFDYMYSQIAHVICIHLVVFYPYVHQCMTALYTRYFPESCEHSHRHITRVGFEPTTLAILEQCLTN